MTYQKKNEKTMEEQLAEAEADFKNALLDRYSAYQQIQDPANADAINTEAAINGRLKSLRKSVLTMATKVKALRKEMGMKYHDVDQSIRTMNPNR